jgi:hypothetical protein
MADPSAPVCTTCKHPIGKDRTFLPFCSARCRQVDLGKWLNEEYRMPSENDGSGPDENEEGKS